MALIVEDGTIVAGAESYLSVAAADTYFSDRGNADWSVLSVADKEQALRKATDYLSEQYRGRWKGYRTNPTSQALDWPRQNVPFPDAIYPQGYVDMHTIPQEVKRASAELAVRASLGELNPDLERGVRQEQVGPINVTYDENSPQAVRYVAIDAILRPYVTGGGAIAKLQRV